MDLNVIIVNDSASITGGAEKVAIFSAIGLANRGIHVVFFSAVFPIDKSLLEAGVKVICLNQRDILNEPNRLNAVKQGWWNVKARKEFDKLLQNYSPLNTVIHFHSWTKALSSSLFSVTAKYHFSVIITSHEYFTVCPNGGMFDYQKMHICELKPMSLQCALCNCDVRNYPQKVWRFIRQIIQNYEIRRNRLYMIFISQLTHDILLPYLYPILERSYIVNNPIDINLKEPVPIVNNDTYLFMARLSQEKGVELFCQAMTDLNLKGCVLGDGYLLQSLRRKYPSVYFAGWVTGEDKEKLIRKGKALIFPSLWYEGAPLTIMEMKSYGIPCIVPDKCAASEQIIDGETGFIFKTGNLFSLEQAILKYENSNLMDMHNKLLESFSAKDYSLVHHIDNLIKVYNDIIHQQ